MLTEKYVSFETAKRLHELKFDGECRAVYEPDGNMSLWYGRVSKLNLPKENVLCPTIQMVIDWFIKKYELYISVVPFDRMKTAGGNTVLYKSLVLDKYLTQNLVDGNCWSLKEANDTAIEWCINKITNNGIYS